MKSLIFLMFTLFNEILRVNYGNFLEFELGMLSILFYDFMQIRWISHRNGIRSRKFEENVL